MKILFAASECVPYCKTGGLADVVGALSETLAGRRHQVQVMLPLYRAIDRKAGRLKPLGRTFSIQMAGREEQGSLWEARPRPNLRVIFIESAYFFDRPGIYGDKPGADFVDNDFRYAFFCRAALEAAKTLGLKPDLVHCHDWQTGLISAHLKTTYRGDPDFPKTASLFTIHNMAYQGNFPKTSFPGTGLPDEAFRPGGLEFYGQVNYLKAGLVYSDAVNTVSPTYAREILSGPEFGCGLEGVLQQKRDRFVGILNGLDLKYWNPKTDPFLTEKFDEQTLADRNSCKEDLQRTLELAVDSETPIAAFIGRLDRQKGIDVLIEISASLLAHGFQILTLGVGHLDYVQPLERLRDRYPSQVRVITSFSEQLAHRIYGGSDLFLMPSRYEPCGLSQMIAMRYGSLPVVTPTGGLMDTVSPISGSKKGTGFLASGKTPGAFLSAIMGALEILKNPEKKMAAQKRAMTSDFSWASSVKAYEQFYRRAASWRA